MPGAREREIRGTTARGRGQPDDGRADDVTVSRWHVDRVVGLYLLAGGVWIALGGSAAQVVAGWTGLSVTAIEFVKGLVFVLLTALVLRGALRRWADRIELAHAAELAAADRMRDIEHTRSRFVTSISHELRTPLTNIVGYALTLKAHGDRCDTEQTEQFLDRIVANSRRLERQVLNLLDLGSPPEEQVLDVRPSRLDELVRRVLAEVPLHDHHVEFDVDPIESMLDPRRTERIVSELLVNAATHTAPGTTVVIRGFETEQVVVLMVEDDGCGVEPALHDEIFEPFRQGHQAEQAPSPGLGVGLSVVYASARAQGGDVRFEPVTGGGARFVVRLPRVALDGR